MPQKSFSSMGIGPNWPEKAIDNAEEGNGMSTPIVERTGVVPCLRLQLCEVFFVNLVLGWNVDASKKFFLHVNWTELA